MRAVYLTEILWALIRVVEVKHFLGRNDRVEIAEDEEDWKMAAQFFENAEVVDREDVETYLLACSLLDHIQKGPQQKQGHLYLPTRDSLNYSAERPERRVQDQSIDLIRVCIGEHDGTKTAHTSAPNRYPAHLHVFPYFLQHVADVEDFVHSVAQERWVAVAAAQEIEGSQVEAKLTD